MAAAPEDVVQFRFGDSQRLEDVGRRPDHQGGVTLDVNRPPVERQGMVVGVDARVANGVEVFDALARLPPFPGLFKL